MAQPQTDRWCSILKRWPISPSDLSRIGLTRIVHRARLEIARARYRDRPAPLTAVRALQSRHLYDAGLGTSLFPRESALKRAGSELSDEVLRKMFADEELGWWSLAVDSIDFLMKRIEQARPRYILEFGSGISTLCMAVAMRRIHGDEPRIFSIEQDKEEIERVRLRLARNGLASMVSLVHAPLDTVHVNGRAVTCYKVHEHDLTSARFDFVLIDGPNGPPGIRWGTLPSVITYLRPGSVFLMDDALRDAEIEIAQKWSEYPGIRVDGIVFRGKGFLCGSIGEARSSPVA